MTDFKVMLAKPVASEINWPNTHFVQPKLDGVRCYINQHGAFSRNHKPFHNAKHILTELKPFFTANPHITLDGELYNHMYRDNFNKIISLVRKQKPTQADKFESASYLQFHCYDLFDSKQPSLPFIDRTLQITNYQSLYKWRSIQEVDTKAVFSDKDVQKFHKQNKQNKYEGSMLRNNNPYDQRRSNNLQKVKDWSDTEITITGFVEGKGKFKSGLGKFLGVDSDNRVVEVPWPTLTIPQRQLIWSARESYIGSPLTFEYFERTPSGAYRFPRAKAMRNYE
jgi:ATP-dependent DNA ligase|tara:strand:+ start:125 stop:967 length:843 start_codon:yes stop_codon:yes gene_type:complete